MNVPGKMLKILLQNVPFYFWMSILKKCDSKQQKCSVHREVCNSGVHEGVAISMLQRGPPASDDGRPREAAAASGQAAGKRTLGRGGAASQRREET